jgi:dTDP-D-glucose 4,6-dehydratase
MKVLITGGAGYIGSTIANALESKGHIPIILDSLVTGKKAFTKGKIFYQGDSADVAMLKHIFNEHPDIFCTIHCAARIVVPESVEQPYMYYFENVCKSLELFKNLDALGFPRVVFSSSASVYGSVSGKVTEQSPLLPDSPYARTKYMMEMVLKDLTAATTLRGTLILSALTPNFAPVCMLSIRLMFWVNWWIPLWVNCQPLRLRVLIGQLEMAVVFEIIFIFGIWPMPMSMLLKILVLVLLLLKIGMWF